MNPKKHLQSVLAFVSILMIAAVYVYASSCEPTLVIGLCSAVRLVSISFLVLTTLNFLVVSTIAYKFKINKIKKPANLRLFIIYFFLIILSFAIALIEIKILSSYRSFKDLSQISNTANSLENTYSINDFKEEKVKNSTGENVLKTSFKLTINKNGSYGGVVKILPKDEKSPLSPYAIFGDINSTRFDNVPMVSSIPLDFEFLLSPNESFYKLKENGPYYLTVQIFPVGQAKSDEFDYGAVFSGNPKHKDFKSDELSVFYFEESMITKAYNYSEF